MANFLASFEITSLLASLAELSSTLGMSPGPSSHDRGTDLRTGEPTPAVWKLESTAPDDASLEEHLDLVFSELSALDLTNLTHLPKDAEVYLSVAVFTHNPMGSVSIPRRFLSLLREIPMDLVATCYFCEENE